MNIPLREASSSTHIYEDEVARRWYALPPGVLLPLSNGDTCQLLFVGRPGSAIGPDVHDAIVRFFAPDKRCVGDVEFHVRASDWITHQHHTDARYNHVILHVVLICDNTVPALRQDGTLIPMCSLYDIPLLHMNATRTTWPCHTIMQHMDAEERTQMLKLAGLLRFEQKTHTFVELLHGENSSGIFNAYDICLISALAEGLGYGRNRDFFRATGRYLLGISSEVPEPLGRTYEPSPLDTNRLSVLRELVERWRIVGAWHTILSHMSHPQISEILPNLRAIFTGLGHSRADILICNVILPFAAAVALIENDTVLTEQAQQLYVEYPSLSSNRITRAMCKQLQLETEPKGACQQQGLHYIYQQTCKEKRCDMCMVGRRKI